jgi:hypothetical protein
MDLTKRGIPHLIHRAVDRTRALFRSTLAALWSGWRGLRSPERGTDAALAVAPDGGERVPRSDVLLMLARLFPRATVDLPRRDRAAEAWVYRAFDRDGSKTVVVGDTLPSDGMTEKLVGGAEPEVCRILGQPGQRRVKLTKVEGGIVVAEHILPRGGRRLASSSLRAGPASRAARRVIE